MDDTEKITVPKDLDAVKRKVAFGMTKRQMLCFGLGALIGLPLFFLLKDKTGTTVAAGAMIAVMIPFFLLALYEKDKRPLEKLVRDFINVRFVRPKIRLYMTENLYDRAAETMHTAREVALIVGKNDGGSEKKASRADPLRKEKV